MFGFTLSEFAVLTVEYSLKCVLEHASGVILYFYCPTFVRRRDEEFHTNTILKVLSLSVLYFRLGCSYIQVFITLIFEVLLLINPVFVEVLTSFTVCYFVVCFKNMNSFFCFFWLPVKTSKTHTCTLICLQYCKKYSTTLHSKVQKYYQQNVFKVK